MNKTNIFIFCFTAVILLCAYLQYNYDPLDLTYSIKITDSRIYRDTPAYDLALAVFRENTNKIRKIVEKSPELVNYQDPHFGAPLIYFAVQNEKYDSLRTLLELGADPNIRATKMGGETALYAASCYAASDNDAKQDPKYVELLLSYKADPDLSYLGGDKDEVLDNHIYEKNISPLMNSIACSPLKMRAIYGSGADINQESLKGFNALDYALKYSYLDGTDRLKFALELIKERNMNVNRCKKYEQHTECLVDILRDLTPEIGSEKHKIKMQIVEEFAKQGVDYWSTPIQERTLEQIKKLYPDTWQDYITEY